MIFNEEGCDRLVLGDTIYFNVPSDGVCVVKGEPNYGVLNLSVSYEAGLEIPFVQRWQDMGQDSVYAHSYTVGSHGLSPNDIKTISLIIGTRNNASSDIDELDRFNPIDFIDTYHGCR